MTLHRKMPSLHAKCFAAESQKAHERSISAAMLEILCAFRTALSQAVAAFADNRNATGAVPLETNSQSHRKKIWPVAKYYYALFQQSAHTRSIELHLTSAAEILGKVFQVLSILKIWNDVVKLVQHSNCWLVASIKLQPSPQKRMTCWAPREKVLFMMRWRCHMLHVFPGFCLTVAQHKQLPSGNLT
jgi:hypothetical protein